MNDQEGGLFNFKVSKETLIVPTKGGMATLIRRWRGLQRTFVFVVAFCCDFLFFFVFFGVNLFFVICFVMSFFVILFLL